jgi:hypothetical protein
VTRIAAALAVLACAGAAAAHERSVSYSRWTLDARGADVEVRVTRLDLSRLGAAPEDAPATIARAVQLFAGDAAAVCTPSAPPTARAAAEGWVVFAWRLDCPAGRRTIASRLLLDVAPSHLHFARVAAPDGTVVERALAETETRWALASIAEGASFGRYVALGIEHIATGWDHLAFVLGLLLLSTSLGEVATLVTAFTLAHSVTLALAAFGAVHVAAGAVEAAIAFSIALVAAENAWLLGGRDRWTPWIAPAVPLAAALLAGAGAPRLMLVGLALFTGCHLALLDRAARPAGLRAAVAFAFGLVHGLGFASVLGNLDLSADRRVPALLGFNLGVEAGQLAVVTAAWPLLRVLARRPPTARLVAELASAVLVAVGLFLFATRI